MVVVVRRPKMKNLQKSLVDAWLAQVLFLAQVLWALLYPWVGRAGVLQGRPDALALEVAPTALVSAPRVVGGRQRLSKQTPRLSAHWKLARDLPPFYLMIFLITQLVQEQIVIQRIGGFREEARSGQTSL